MKKIIAVAVGLAAFGASSLALAQEKAPAAPGAPAAEEKEFGNPGVLAVEADTSANLGYTSVSVPGAPSGNFIDIALQPSAQYFVIEGLSLGGTISFDWKKPNQGDSRTTFGIGPTVGYNLWLSPGSLSLWPQATFSFNSASTTITSGTTSISGTDTIMNVGIFAPLLIHPVKHFHVGVGPYFNVDVSSKESAGGVSVDGEKATNVGIKLDIGGWL